MCLETPASNSILVLNLWEAIEMLLYEHIQNFANHKTSRRAPSNYRSLIPELTIIYIVRFIH